MSATAPAQDNLAAATQTATQTATATLAAIKAASAPAASAPVGFVRRLLQKPLAWVALLWLAAMLVGALGAPWLAPYDPLDQDLLMVKQLPSAEHWLGTDGIGRDVLSRVLHGALPTFIGVAQALLVVALLGITMG